MASYIDPGYLLHKLQSECDDPLARHVLSQAMLHVNNWWFPGYSRSALKEFFA